MHHVTVASKVLSTSLLTVMVVLCVCLCVQDPELKVENDEGAKAGKIHFIGLAHSHATGKGMHIGSIDIPFFLCVCVCTIEHMMSTAGLILDWTIIYVVSLVQVHFSFILFLLSEDAFLRIYIVVLWFVFRS